MIYLINFSPTIYRVDSPGTPRRRSSANAAAATGRRSSSLTPNPEVNKPLHNVFASPMAVAGNTTPRGSISNIANRGRSTSNHQLMMMNGRQTPQQQQQLGGGVKNMGGRNMPPPPPPPPQFGRSKSPGSLIPVGANGYHSNGHKHSGNLVRKLSISRR